MRNHMNGFGQLKRNTVIFTVVHNSKKGIIHTTEQNMSHVLNLCDVGNLVSTAA